MAPVESTPNPHATVPDPLANAKFSLNSLGVAGFFGADVAVNGMATVIFFAGRRLGGLYNSPGSLEIARRYGQLADSRVYRGLFPGDTTDPAQLFGLDGKDGPRFLGARSGSLIERTSHLGYLIARMAKRRPCAGQQKDATRGQRSTTPGTVTVIDLRHLGRDNPESLIYPTLPPSVEDARSVVRTPLKHYGLLALFPVLTSIGACVGSALVADWWSFGCILIGIIANGCACFVLGSGKLAFKHPNSAQTAPRGDGILWAGNDIVVIRGSERAVNTITRGRLFLQYDEDAHGTSSALSGPPAENGENSNVERDSESEGDAPLIGKGEQKLGREGDYDAPKGGKPNGFWIGIASLLLILQFLAQLLLIPQATLFGQIMFVCTLAASGAYNAYLSSINREDIQTRILCGILQLTEERIRKFEFATWTSTATFACLALLPDDGMRLPDSSKVLNALIPNDTELWNRWKNVMRKKLRSRRSWEEGMKQEKQKEKKQKQRLKERESGHDQETTEDEDQQRREEEMFKLLNADAELAHRRYLDAFPEQ